MIMLHALIGKKKVNDWRKDEVPGCLYGLSDKGWVNSELFKGWLVENFIEHAVAVHPLLLLLDGHSGIVHITRLILLNSMK